jgi:undecaprenyl-diphosphatase
MNYCQAIILGILQGLTEFFPVSSSGHLVVAQSIMPNFSQPGVLFDVVLHLGTLAAVLIYFRSSILKMKSGYLKLIIIGSIPAAAIGFLFQDLFEGLFAQTTVVGIALLITAFVNYLTDKAKKEKNNLNLKDALLVGFAQAAAIVPGISRSGLTIFTGTRLGVDRKKAAEFSFILSVPAILGASVLQSVKYYSQVDGGLSIYLSGFAFAALSGYIAIYFVIKILESKRFVYFAVYCAVLGFIALLLA